MVKVHSLCFHDHYDFVRVSEYFTGKENFSGKVILRTKQENRSGLYFRVKLKMDLKKSSSAKRKLTLMILDSQSLEFDTYYFELPQDVMTQDEVLLGLTGEDWSSPELFPVAWKLEMHSPDGKILTSDQSELWSHRK